MGRFSSVQTYTDTASDKRTIPYEQVVKNAPQQQQSVQPEKVVNPYGSTAGAGSGEFHIYRQARAREMQRQAVLQQTAQQQEEARAFALKRQQEQEECAARTAKRRAKRLKQKSAKARKRNLEQAGVVLERPGVTEDDDEDEEEFVYVPEKNVSEEPNRETGAPNETAISNDGSFIEKANSKETKQEESTT